jgi:hypothetical protein
MTSKEVYKEIEQTFGRYQLSLKLSRKGHSQLSGNCSKQFSWVKVLYRTNTEN